jgi:hypothetical protein
MFRPFLTQSCAVVFSIVTCMSFSSAQRPASTQAPQRVQLAELRPQLVWHRTSPTLDKPDGPVLYQIQVTLGTPNTLPKYDASGRHFVSSLLIDNGASVTIGGLQISSSGTIQFANGQTFPGAVGNVSSADNFISIGGTPGSPTIGFKTATGDARYLTLSGGTMTGAITFVAGQTFPSAVTLINSETSRAQAAEATLTTNLNNEISRALSAEGTLTTNLNNEITRAESAESTLTSNLNNEISRAKAAETTLTTNLNNEITRAQSAEGTLTTNLNNEIARAQGAEGTLTTNLNNEITRAQGAESALTTNLSNEISRALAAEANRWNLNGNSGTGCSTSPCAHFLGSTDSDPLEFRVDNQRAYRIEPATDTQAALGFAPNVIGGFSGNAVTGTGTGGATIAGGGASLNLNSVSASFGTVGGGYGNTAGGRGSTVTGGTSNSAGGDNSVAGGASNTASGPVSVVAGGANNTASGSDSTVAGGGSNTASGVFSAVPGGRANFAGGQGSFAAGQFTNDNNGTAHNGVFLFGDNSTGPPNILRASADNTFLARVAGGVTFFTNSTMTTGVTVAAGGGSWASVSDRNLKANVEAIDPQTILARLLATPITTWSYKSQAASIRHIGPMAQDFYAAFSVGEDDRHITDIDEGGVALAAIQGLNQKLEEAISSKDAQIAALESENAHQRRQIAAMQQQMQAVMLRLAAVEKSGQHSSAEQASLAKR